MIITYLRVLCWFLTSGATNENWKHLDRSLIWLVFKLGAEFLLDLGFKEHFQISPAPLVSLDDANKTSFSTFLLFFHPADFFSVSLWPQSFNAKHNRWTSEFPPCMWHYKHFAKFFHLWEMLIEKHKSRAKGAACWLVNSQCFASSVTVLTQSCHSEYKRFSPP